MNVRSYWCEIVLKYLNYSQAMGKELGRENIALKPVCHFKSYLILVTFMPSLYKFQPWIKVLGIFCKRVLDLALFT